MEQKVLVTYASKYGATEEIAGKIGEKLIKSGLQVDVFPVGKISDLSSYNAVVLGSAVYIGQWRKKAVKFIKANEKALAEKMVWLFSTGPTGDGDPVQLLHGWRNPKKLQPIIDRIKPHDIAVFHGEVDVKKLNSLEKWMISKVKSPVGDFRDWDVIDSWADGIAEAVKEKT